MRARFGWVGLRRVLAPPLLGLLLAAPGAPAVSPAQDAAALETQHVAREAAACPCGGAKKTRSAPPSASRWPLRPDE
jgi:hypothetical protein